jgi:flagellar basal-body rod modification protein FlgD
MSLASVAASQNAALTAADAAAAGLSTTSTTTTSQTASQTALSSLSGNFQTFLSMLMTQLQNQDPTSPMDTNQFTSQLVEFASVEQQINTNSSLTQLIQLTQAGDVLQSSAMVGKQVAVESDHIPVQSGTGTVDFTMQSAGTVGIAIYNDAGTKLYDTTLNASSGANTWTWNGQTSSGTQVADGSYRIAVVTADSSGNTSSVPFTVVGTATGVQQGSSALQLQLGALSVDFSAVKSVLN